MAHQQLPPPTGDYIFLLDATPVVRRVTIRAESRIRIGPNGEIYLMTPSPYDLTAFPYIVSSSGGRTKKVITLSELDGNRVVTISLELDRQGELQRLYKDSTWPWRNTYLRIVMYPEMGYVISYLDSFK